MSAFPQLTPVYGIVASLFFGFAYSFTNILVSPTKINHKVMLVVGTFLFSATNLVAGITQSFYLFALMRMALGVFSSFINTPIYKMIADHFKPD